MFEVVVQVRLWVGAADEDEAEQQTRDELTSWFDETLAPDWIANAIVEVKTVKPFGRAVIPS